MATLPIRPRQASGAWGRSIPLRGFCFVLACGSLAGRAGAQGPTVDASVPSLPGSGMSLMGNPPGSGGSVFTNLPGEGGILGGRPGVSYPKGIPTSITTPGTAASPTALQDITAPPAQPVGATTGPTYGTLSIPTAQPAEEDNPPDGLDLDQIIDFTLQRSLDLKSKFYEIPMSRADILQAGLRANPIFYQDGQLLQYRGQPFSRARPGGPQQFDTNVTVPLDVSHKRLARVEVTTRAQKVLEAYYQEAVRQRIDDVYDAYVAALSARQTARYARNSVEGLEKLAARQKQLFDSGGVINRAELIKVQNQLRTTQLRLLHAQADYRKALLDLGSLMNLSSDEVDQLKIKGSIVVQAPPPPPLDDLKQIALAERPDVLSFRLGIQRAQADVRLAKANAYSDVYLLWQPYTFQDNSPYGLKSATSWALGLTVPLPIFNRNQGGIERAKINVTQSHVQLADVERQAQVDVAKALQDLDVNRREVEELQDHVVPEARVALGEVAALLQKGERSLSDFLNAQLEFNDIVEQYLDTAIRYRRSMLAINTVTGKRIMP